MTRFALLGRLPNSVHQHVAVRRREIGGGRRVSRPAVMDLRRAPHLESLGETVDNAAWRRHDHQTRMRTDAWPATMDAAVTNLAVEHIVADTASLRPCRHGRHRGFAWRETELARSALPH